MNCFTALGVENAERFLRLAAEATSKSERAGFAHQARQSIDWLAARHVRVAHLRRRLVQVAS